MVGDVATEYNTGTKTRMKDKNNLNEGVSDLLVLNKPKHTQSVSWPYF